MELIPLHSSGIVLSRVIPHADEIIGDHQCIFECNKSKLRLRIPHSSDT